jgi:tape measure domain-containing protein
VVLDARTTIGFQDAVQGSLRLQSIGFSADQAREAIRQLGIATTASGKSSEDLGEVTNQLTQIIGRGQVLQQDIRVILDRLPILSKVFKETFGGVNAEAIRNSTANVGEFAAKLFTAIQQGEDFQNVQFSAAKAVETFKESAQLAGAAIGKQIFESLRLDEVLTLLSDTINKLVAGFQNLSPETQRNIATFAALLAVAGPLLIALGALARIVPILAAGVKSLGLIGGAVVVAFGAALFAVQDLAAELGGLDNALAFVQAKLSKTAAFWKEIFRGISKEVNILGRSIKAALGFEVLDENGRRQTYAQILREEGFSIVKAQEEANKAFEESLKKYVDKRNEGFRNQQNILRQSQEFDFNTLVGKFQGALGDGTETTGTAAGKTREKPIALLPKIDPGVGSLREISNTFFALPDQVKSITSGVISLSRALESTSNPATKLKSNIGEILTQSRILGASVEEQYTGVINEIRNTLVAVTQEFGSQSAVVSELQNILGAYQENFNTFLDSQQRQLELQQAVGNAIAQAGDIIGRSFEDAANGARAFGRAVLEASSVIISAFIREGVTGLVKNILSGTTGKALGPLALGVAAAAGAAASGLFRSLISKIQAPKLAAGGLATGPTLAVVGDNRNARVDPEVIAPLSKLKGMLGGEGFIAEARISGDDLLLLVSRADQRLNLLR